MAEKTPRSPIAVQKYLGGIDYPVSKTELRRAAERNGAPDDVLQVIDELPDDRFDAPTDVMKAFGAVR